MKTISKIFILTAVVIVAVSCYDDYQDSVRFCNNSNKDIYLYMEQHPRDSFPHTMRIDRALRIAKPYKQMGYAFNKMPNTDSTYWYILDKDSVIANKYKVLQQYTISISRNEMVGLNDCLTYPPTDAMKHIKMYPAYKEGE